MNRSAGSFSQAHRTFAANELTQNIGFRKGNDLSIEISNGATSAGVMPPSPWASLGAGKREPAPFSLQAQWV